MDPEQIHTLTGRRPFIAFRLHETEGLFPRPGTPEWGLMNRRRAELIRKDISGVLTPDERAEYEALQQLSLTALDDAFPLTPPDEDRTHDAQAPR